MARMPWRSEEFSWGSLEALGGSWRTMNTSLEVQMRCFWEILYNIGGYLLKRRDGFMLVCIISYHARMVGRQFAVTKLKEYASRGPLAQETRTWRVCP